MRFLITFLIVCFFSLELSGQENLNREREAIFIQQINLEAFNQRFNANNSGRLRFRNINSTNHQLVITQIGDGNLLSVRTGVKDFQKINQKGNRNYYNFINYYNSRPSNVNILQQGEGNSLHIYGKNSFMDKIKIYQKSDYKSITIRNF